MVAEVIGHDEDDVRTVFLAVYWASGGEEEEKEREENAVDLHGAVQGVKSGLYASNLGRIGVRGFLGRFLLQVAVRRFCLGGVGPRPGLDYVHSLRTFPSLSSKDPHRSMIKSIKVHRPRPPKVRNWATPVPAFPT